VIGLAFRILGAGAVLNKLAVTFSPLGVDKSSVRLRNGLFLPSKSLGGGMKESRVPRDEVSSPLVSPGVVGGGKDMELDEGRAGVADRPDPETGVATLGVTGCGVSGADEDGGVGGKSWALFWLCKLNRTWQPKIQHKVSIKLSQTTQQFAGSLSIKILSKLPTQLAIYGVTLKRNTSIYKH
jgi:hypothetical protein